MKHTSFHQIQQLIHYLSQKILTRYVSLTIYIHALKDVTLILYFNHLSKSVNSLQATLYLSSISVHNKHWHRYVL